MKRPKVITSPVADKNNCGSERTIEIVWPNGKGCLVLLRGGNSPETTGGPDTPVLEIYRADPEIRVHAPDDVKLTTGVHKILVEFELENTALDLAAVETALDSGTFQDEINAIAGYTAVKAIRVR